MSFMFGHFAFKINLKDKHNLVRSGFLGPPWVWQTSLYIKRVKAASNKLITNAVHHNSLLALISDLGVTRLRLRAHFHSKLYLL